MHVELIRTNKEKFQQLSEIFAIPYAIITKEYQVLYTNYTYELLRHLSGENKDPGCIKCNLNLIHSDLY